MAEGIKHTTRTASSQTPQRSVSTLPILLVISIAVAAVVTFGNPILWMTGDQAEVLNHEDPVQTPDTPTPASEPDPEPQQDDKPAATVLGEYKALSQSDDVARTENIKLAVDAINDQEIAPGATFSFNDVVGDTENDEAYQVAPVVNGSDMAYARGGGICQVSSALYIAALLANVDVVERHPHSLAVDYAPIGLDATLVYGVMDLKIKNTTDYPIKIVAESEGQMATVKLMGHPRNDGISIDTTSKIIQITEDKTKTNLNSDTPSEYSIYTVESYKVYYENGNKVKSERLSTDTYGVQQALTVTLTEGGSDPTK